MFSFSLFVNTLKKSMVTPLSDEELINLLIEDIVKSLSLENQDGDLLYIDKQAASKIMNNKRNLPQKIKSSLVGTAASIEGLEKHLKKEVIPLLIPEEIERVYQVILDELKRYKDIPRIIADEIYRCEDTADYVRLMAIALRFSFMIPNKHDAVRSVEKTTPPLKKILEYLRYPADWDSSYSRESDIRYYKYAPEYTIEHTFESEDGRDGYEYYLFSQRDTTPHWTDIRLKYHQTVLYHVQGVLLDGGRYFTPCPEWGVVRPFSGRRESIIYKYLIKDSCDEIIHKFYYNIKDPEERYAHDKFVDSIIVFSSEEEQKRFSKYADYKWDEYERKEFELQIPYIKANSEKATAHYENIFRNVRLLQVMYRDFLSME